MSTVPVLLFLLSLVLLVWGVISPASLFRHRSNAPSRGRTALLFGVISFALFVLVGITAPPQKTPVSITPASNVTKTQPQTAEPKVAGDKTTKITTKTVTETQVVPFTSSTVNDASLAKGTTKITTVGVNGQKTLTYTVTYNGGTQTDKKLVSDVTTKQPVTQITAIGTKVAQAVPVPTPAPSTPAPQPSNCDPNYSGACVPIASDVDCLGGTGNGPAYVKGPVTVIGVDIYDLDRDGNGIGCE